MSRVDMYFQRSKSMDRKAAMTMPTPPLKQTGMLVEGQTSQINVALTPADTDYQMGLLADRICVSHLMTSSSRLKGW